MYLFCNISFADLVMNRIVEGNTMVQIMSYLKDVFQMSDTIARMHYQNGLTVAKKVLHETQSL
jgi:hypothetical protein